MDNGRVVEQGKHKDLVAKKGLYSTLWRLQSGEETDIEVRITR